MVIKAAKIIKLSMSSRGKCITFFTLLSKIIIGVLMMIFMLVGEAAARFQCVQSPVAGCDDQIRFFWIKQYSEVIQYRSIWKGRFNLETIPLYIVHWDGKTADKSFLINSPVDIKGASKLPPEIAQGSRVHRYDGRLNAASKTPNRLFEMPFNIDGTPFFMMLYKDQDESDIEVIPTKEWLRILIHEVFHEYQIGWIYPAYGAQDDPHYPLTRDIVALSLLEIKIVSAGFKTHDKSVHRDLLKMFVAVRTEKIEKDPSGKGLVKKMDNVQEYLEGSAKYFEIKVFEQFHPRFPQKHFAFEIDDVLRVGFQTKDEVREFFTFGMWYFTGSIVLRMMDNADIPFIRAMEKGSTPYEFARLHFNLSSEGRRLWLHRAKQEFNFHDLVKQAERYLKL